MTSTWFFFSSWPIGFGFFFSFLQSTELLSKIPLRLESLAVFCAFVSVLHQRLFPRERQNRNKRVNWDRGPTVQINSMWTSFQIAVDPKWVEEQHHYPHHWNQKKKSELEVSIIDKNRNQITSQTIALFEKNHLSWKSALQYLIIVYL